MFLCHLKIVVYLNISLFQTVGYNNVPSVSNSIQFFAVVQMNTTTSILAEAHTQTHTEGHIYVWELEGY